MDLDSKVLAAINLLKKIHFKKQNFKRGFVLLPVAPNLKDFIDHFNHLQILTKTFIFLFTKSVSIRNRN